MWATLVLRKRWTHTSTSALHASASSSRQEDQRCRDRVEAAERQPQPIDECPGASQESRPPINRSTDPLTIIDAATVEPTDGATTNGVNIATVGAVDIASVEAADGTTVGAVDIASVEAADGTTVGALDIASVEAIDGISRKRQRL